MVCVYSTIGYADKCDNNDRWLLADKVFTVENE